MKNEYHVGELSKFFGVSRDTLRLYDKIGILSPEKNESNHYRSYNRADLICLDYVMRLRRIDLPLSDIKMMVTDSRIEKAEAMMRLQEKELTDKIQELQKLLVMVRDYQKCFGNMIHNLGEITIKDSPVLICKDVGESMIDGMSEFSVLQTSHVPFFTLAFEKSTFLSEYFRDSVVSEEDRRQMYQFAITMIDDENLAQRHGELPEGFRVIMPRKCVFSAVKCYTNVNYDELLMVRQYIIDHGLKLTGDVLLRIISVRNSIEESVDYYEIWAPVE